MAVLRGAAGWIIRQAAAGGRRWRACPPCWRLALAAGAAAVRSGKAGRLAGCGRCAGGAGLALVRGHRVRRSAAGVVIWCGAVGADPSRCRRWAQYPCTVSSACRAADPAGRAGGKARQKKKARAAARGALLLWPSVCTGGAICCAGCVPVHIVGGGVCSPFRCRAAGAGTDPGATVPAGNVPAWHGLRWRCSIRCVFVPPPEGSDSPLYRVVL